MAIAIVDYCKGNLRSVQKGLESIGVSAFISSDVDKISKANAIILPGVGAFADASITMKNLGQLELLREMINDGVPFLGICLGLHLLFEYGSEGPGGDFEGLGILKGRCDRLPSVIEGSMRVKIPHVGWNTIERTSVHCPILDVVPKGTHFYFTHSYRCIPDEEGVIAGTTNHGIDFVSAVCYKNIYGVQFHPEKSSAAGMQVLAEFVKVSGV